MKLEILTRHLVGRELGLAANQASLRSQTSPNWFQTLLVDEVGRGVPWANKNLGEYGPFLKGDYIWILDDDDICVDDTLVEEIESIAILQQPSCIIVKGVIGNHGVLPEDNYWRLPPVYGHIGVSNFIIRRDIWQRYASSWPERIAGDYAFIRAVYEGEKDTDWYWYDAVVMTTPNGASQGAR